MGYYGLQSYTSQYTNPFLMGSNPFLNYNNPFLNYTSNSFGSSLFSKNYVDFSSYGFYPQVGNYNFLNNPTFTNQNFSTPYSGNFGFGSYNTLASTSNIGGFGSYNNYNLLNNSTNIYQNSSFNPYYQNLSNPYSFANYNSFNTFSSQPTQTTVNQNQEQSQQVSEKTLNKASYGPEFLAKVKRIANELNCNYKDLLGVMNSESGIKTDAVNKKSNATGLIQFMPRTAQGLGTTVDELKRMTPVEQLDYVEKYLKNTKRQAGFSENTKLSAGQLYALVFMPAKAKKEVFTQSGETAYNWNKGLDLNHDGKITMTELGQRVKNNYVSDRSFVA